jgi:hypothetical protein
MSYTIADYVKEYRKNFLQDLSVEERLTGLSPDQRLHGLSPNEVLQHQPGVQSVALCESLRESG